MNPPPHSVEAERAVLGVVMLNNATVADAMSLLVPDSFYVPNHRQIFAACLELWPGEMIDPVSLYEHLERKVELAYLSGLLDDVVTSATISHHAGIVADLALTRRVMFAGQQIADMGRANPPDVQEYASNARNMISDAGAGAGRKQALVSLSEGLSGIAGEILDSKGVTGRLKTGFSSIDSLAGGLYSDLLTVLAGRPSMGKSALALNIAVNVARGGNKVAYFSLEDARQFLQRRIIARLADVPLSKIIHGGVKSEKYSQVLNAIKIMDNLPLWVSDRGQSVAEIRQSAWAQHVSTGLDLIVIDHLGYISDPGKEYEVVSAATRSFAFLAKELHVPVLLLVQLNRAVGSAKDGNIPTLKNLRGSGKIEEDARAVWFAHRPWYYDSEDGDPNEFRLIVAKNSHGPTGVATLWCDLARMYFRDHDNGGGY